MHGYDNPNEYLGKNLAIFHSTEQLENDVIPFNEEVKKHGTYNGEIRHITKEGKAFPTLMTSTLLKDQQGNPFAIAGIAKDITERKQAEEEIKISRERLKILNKIIRHDLSNDFNVIRSAVRIFKDNFNAEMLDEIEKRAERSINTIDDYKNYESFIDSNTNLYEIEITDLINNLIFEFPKIKFNIEGEGKVFADDALGSVFTNLISNSIKHGDSSKIDISISSDKNICKIMFMDDGKEIPDKIKDKIFEEGFVFGKAGHTGIELHIVRKTIEHYGGYISVEDNKPQGTIFIIRLRNALQD